MANPSDPLAHRSDGSHRRRRHSAGRARPYQALGLTKLHSDTETRQHAGDGKRQDASKGVHGRSWTDLGVEAVGQVLRMGHRLARHQPDVDPVGVAGAITLPKIDGSISLLTATLTSANTRPLLY